MNDIPNKSLVLVLNRNWQAINIRTPADAFCQLATNVATALDIEGDEHIRPVQWTEWIIHLMRTGEVEANLVTLNEEFKLPYLAELVARKLAGPEKSKLEDADIAFHEAEYQRLRGELQAAHDQSRLPELPSVETRQALNRLLLAVRLRASGPA